MSTLPKSIQANQAASGDGQSSLSALEAKRQACRELSAKYKRLPDDFLKIPSSYYASFGQSPQNDSLAMSAHRALGINNHGASNGPLVDMVDISVVEAVLVKNYGLLRMDLYCKIRVGHMVCETPTCPNGAKNPKWDGVYQFSLKPGIDSFHLEIYDEKQFSLDEKIAWLHEPIPPEIFQGITVERWFPLSGRSGPQKEGSVLLVISHKRVPMRSSNYGRSMIPHHHHQLPAIPETILVPGPNQMIGGPTSVMPVDPSVTAYLQPIPPPPPNPQTNPNQQPPDGAPHQREVALDVRPAREEDINQLSEMFPSIDKAIIKAILENNHHDKEASISALLAMG